MGEALLLLGGAAFLYIFTTSRAAGHLTFYPSNITGMSLDFSPEIYATLLVQNTSNSEFTIYSLSANATTDNTLVGNVSNFIPVTIPANSEHELPLTIRLLPLTIVQNFLDALRNHGMNTTFQLEGTVNANGVQIPLSLTYKIAV